MGLKSYVLPYFESLRGAVKGWHDSGYWPNRPQGINIEITAACDADCIHCPRQAMDRPVRHMSMPLFRLLIDQAAEIGVPELYPNGYGELLLVKGLDDYFSYISSKAHKFRMIVNTNGHLLTDDKIRVFIRHNVYLVNVTIDGATQETAQSIRRGLDTARIEDNIRRLLRIRSESGVGYPKLRVGMIVIPQNSHEVDAFRRKWEGIADFVGFGGFSNRAGSVGFREEEPEAPTGAANGARTPESHPCLLPFRDMSIWSDGRAVLCCDDWNEEHVVGDLNKQSLREIWHGPALTEARRLHRRRLGDRIGICAKCNFWRKPAAGMRLWG